MTRKKKKPQPIPDLLYFEGQVYTWVEIAEELKRRLNLLDILDIEFADHEDPACAWVWITYTDIIRDIGIEVDETEFSFQIVYKKRVFMFAKTDDREWAFDAAARLILKTREEMQGMVAIMTPDGYMGDDERADEFQSKLGVD